MLEARSCAGLASVLTLTAFLAPAFAQPPPPPPEPPPPPPAEPPPPPVETSITPAAVPPAPPPSAPGGLKIEGTGGATMRLGFLLQSGFEYDTATTMAEVKSTSFFLRRARLMVGMTLGSQFELFAETDAANLGRSGGASGGPAVGMLDAFGTWKPMDELKLDVGLFLIPFSHNSIQGAGTLYGLDYFAYTFQQIGPLTNIAGRDLGAQLRGLLMKKLEYRVAVLQGNRGTPMPPTPAPSRTPVRIAARLQLNLLDAETGYFYGGTYGGTKKILSIGGGIDHQDDYNAFAGDAFLDLPLGDDVITAQFNIVHFDGKTWAPGLPKQTDLMAEAGYRIGALRLSPILRVETINYSDAAISDVLRLSGGLAWWVMNHTVNVKLFYTYIKPDSASLHKVSQINLQMQFYVF